MLAQTMKKALAQNPNMLRTLLGLSFTLVFLLGYAVYGATIDTEFYTYTNKSTETQIVLSNSDIILDAEYMNNKDGESTTWVWNFDTNNQNLTWINASLSDGIKDGLLIITNTAKWYSHPNFDEEDVRFNCAEDCVLSTNHSDEIDSDGKASIIGLINPNPARRDGGSIYADSLEEAREKADVNVNHTYEVETWEVRVILPGNHSIPPSVELSYVNEVIIDVGKFRIDAATEMLWSLAAVIGCFSILLVPSFTIYFASQAKEKRQEKLHLEKLNGLNEE